ncbi:MAG TPA: uroporphyrinogen-III synthase [Bryobacteraceae bacterium]|nr:uroporphyrinogen-III synthase [Bryobacteraceae bacterium]
MTEAPRIADFGGLRVLSLESRRAELMEQLIRRHGGRPFVAPSVKEIPFEQHDEVHRWAERLFAGGFDLMVLMTGAGLSFLKDILAEKYPPEAFAQALRRVTLISRGPKPVAVLQEMGVTARVVVPEPNTWREIVAIVAARPERRIAVQEYGRANPHLYAALKALGAEVSGVAIYRWALPDDPGPLREAVRRIAARDCDVVLFTTSIQLAHLMETAEEMGCAGEVRRALMEDLAIGSVGAVMDATLADNGFTPDIAPPHPKMAALVRAAAEASATVVARKRGEAVR